MVVQTNLNTPTDLLQVIYASLDMLISGNQGPNPITEFGLKKKNRVQFIKMCFNLLFEGNIHFQPNLFNFSKIIIKYIFLHTYRGWTMKLKHLVICIQSQLVPRHPF